MVRRATGYPLASLLRDILPFCAAAGAAVVAIWMLPAISGDISRILNPASLVQLTLQIATGASAAIGILALMRVPELSEGIRYLLGRFMKK